MTPPTNSAYTAAMTPASVAVKTPERRPTRMMTGSKIAQKAPPRSLRKPSMPGHGTSERTASLRETNHQVAPMSSTR